MSQSANLNRLQFIVDPITFFVKSLIAVLSTLIYIPAPEQFTNLLKYATSCMRFPDGTTLAYDGSPADIKEPLLPLTILIWAQIILHSIFEDPFIELGLSIAFGLATGYVSYRLLRAITTHLVTSTGSRLNFAATLEEFLRWQIIILACSVGPALLGFILPQTGFFAAFAGAILALVSLLLIVLVMIPYYQFIASKLTGGTRLASFQVEPIEMIGMYFGFIIFSCLIVTIPWSVAWYSKWLMSRFSLPARSAMAAGGYSS